MFAEERQKKIHEYISKNQSAKVVDLSKIFDASDATIRRDLDEMQQNGLIVRTHGGAMLAYSVGRPINSSELMGKDVELKKLIAAKAYTLINDHDTLLLDSSSTVYELVKLLASERKTHLRIITTSLMVVQTLASCKSYKVMIVGGEVNYMHNTVEGYVALDFIKNIRVDKCFVGINGIDDEFGFSTPRYEDAKIKSAMINSSIESVVLADHTKFCKSYLVKVKEPVSVLISDKRVHGFPYENLGEDINVIFAESKNE